MGIQKLKTVIERLERQAAQIDEGGLTWPEFNLYLRLLDPDRFDKNHWVHSMPLPPNVPRFLARVERVFARAAREREQKQEG
jgi:hypothetical protein